jgi:fucose permease
MALGGLVGMLLFDVLYRKTGFRQAMAVVALVVLLPGLAAALPGAVPARGEQSTAHVREVFAEPGLWSAALVMFFYAPLEGFVSVWTATYLQHVGQWERRSNWLAGFWCTVLTSRALLAVLMHSTEWVSYSAWVLVLAAVLVAAILGNMSAMISWQSALGLLLLLGFFLGPLYPSLVGLVLRSSAGEASPATAFAVLHAGGAVGALALSPLVRYCARTRISIGLRIPTALALVMAVTTLLFALLADRGGH